MRNAKSVRWGVSLRKIFKMNARRKEFAEFYSPGTFLHESRFIELHEGTVEEAVRISKDVVERYQARPFGFDIVTRIISPPVDDGEGGEMIVNPKEVERRGRFFLGGKLIDFEDVCKSEGKESIIASNMRNNGYPICIEVINGFRSTHPFGSGDVIVDPETGEILHRGNDAIFEEYRKNKFSEWAKQLAMGC